MRTNASAAGARADFARVLTVGGLSFASLAAPALASAEETKGKAAPSGEVVITARRSSLDVVAQKILDTPQSIDVIPAQIIREQGVSNLQEALKNVPGITLNAGEGGAHGDLVNLRGFSAGDDYFLDGLRDTGLYDRDAFDVESVEVYKGPASTLFGRGSTGGVVNEVSKTPQLKTFADATLTLGTNEEARAVADVNYRLGAAAAFRLAAMDMSAGVAGRPFVTFKRWGAAPSLALGVGANASFSLKYVHQSEDNLPDYGIPFLFGKPAPVPRSTFYGLPADDRFKSDVDILTGRFEHKFTADWSIADTARYGHYTFDSRQTAAIYGTANCFTVAPYAGAPLCAATVNPVPVTAFNPLFPVFGTPADQVFVERDRPSSTGVIKTLMNSTAATGRFTTFALQHTLVAGVEADREDADLVRFANQNTAIAPTPLLAPDPFEAFPGHQTGVRQLPSTRTQTLGAFAIDTLDFSPHWQMVLGLRYDHFRASFDQPLGSASHFEHVDDVTSPRAALIFKPRESASVYFSYGTSFNPSAENLSLSASNQALAPEKDRTFEIGAKAEVLRRRLALTGALFNTEMTNARIADPLSPGLQALAGELRVNGFEAGAQGYLNSDWEIIAGYTYLDGKADGLVAPGVTSPIPNTAHNQANLWTGYEPGGGWQFGAGLNYVGERAAGADTLASPGAIVIAKVPGYVTVDAMAGYKINGHIRLQINAYNLADKFYYANSYFTRPNENHIIPGAGRTLLFSVSAAL